MSHAAETWPPRAPGPASVTRAVEATPMVSRSRMVTSASTSAPVAGVRPEASGFPRGLTALTITFPGSTASRLPQLAAVPDARPRLAWPLR